MTPLPQTTPPTQFTGICTEVGQDVGVWLSVTVRVSVCAPETLQVNLVDWAAGSAKVPPVDDQAYVRTSPGITPTSASDAAPDTSIVPFSDVWSGEAAHDVSSGQLSPSTTVP